MDLGGNMSPRKSFIRIPLQVGSELRIRTDGGLRVSNPTLEIMSDERGFPLDMQEAAAAALDYRYEPETAEHVLRLLQPVELPLSGLR